MTKSPITFQRLGRTLRVPLLVLGAASRAAGGTETTQTGATPPTSGVAATSTTALKKAEAPAVSKGQSAAAFGGTGVNETNLDAVTVVAPGESIETAWGPVKGYVARESSTATKTDTPLIETPASVSVITDDRMQGQKGQSIETLLNYTAGVRSSAFGFGSVYSGYLIRGYQPSFFQLFRDNLVQYGQMQPEPYGLERIEVLRGPASVLYGEGSPGGLVNMVTKRPTAVPHYEVEMNGGSWGFVQGLADLSGPLDAEGQWRYRFTTKNRNADTQMDFVPDNRVFMAPALAWQPSADTSITVLANFQKDTSNFAPYVPAQGSLFGNPNGQIPTSRYIGEPGFDNRTFTTYSLGYLFEHRFSEDLKIRQNVRYMSADIDFRFTFGVSPLFDNFTTVERESDSTYRQVGVFALDNQLQYKWDLGRVRQTILAGVNYNEITDNFRGSFPDPEAGQGPIPQDVPKNMGSIWAQYEVQGGVLNGLGLGAGMHYTGTTYSFDNALAIPDYTIMDAML